jgi:hypothetical protein
MVVGKRTIFRLLTGHREERTIVESPTSRAEARATQDSGGVQPDAGVSAIASDRSDDAGRLDAAAGCEFVDDRIRLL